MSNGTLSRVDLIDIVADETGVSRKDCAGVLESLLDLIGERVADGNVVKVRNFGRFAARTRGNRVGRDFQKGTELPIEPRIVVAFRSSQKLRHWINNPADMPRPKRRQLDLFD